MSNARQSQYKNLGRDSDSLRKNRVEQTVSIRKEKRDDLMAKRRNILSTGSNDLEDLAQEKQRPSNFSPEELLQRIRSNDPSAQLQAVTQVRKLLSSDRNPPIDLLLSAGVLPALLQCLSSPDPKLQVEATWAITNIASGNPDQTRAVVDASGVPILLELLNSSAPEVCDQAVWALGNIIGDGPKLRDFCLELGVLQPLLNFVGPTTPPAFLRNVVWVLVNICRSKKPPLPVHVVQAILPAFFTLVHHQDMGIVTDTIWALSYITDCGYGHVQLVIDSGLVPFLVPFLASTEIKLVLAAVRMLGNIVTGTDEQTQVVLDSGALKHIASLLAQKNQKLNKETIWFVSNVAAGTKEQVEAVCTTEIFSIIIERLGNGEFGTQQEAAWAVANVSLGGTQTQVQLMVELGVIAPLCALLAVRDPQIVHLVLDSIKNMLSKCQPDALVVVCGMIEECNGLDMIEHLQTHRQQDIYQLAYEIIATYFSEDDDIMGQQNSLSVEEQQKVPEQGFLFQ